MVLTADPISRSLEALEATVRFLSGDELREKSSVSDCGEGPAICVQVGKILNKDREEVRGPLNRWETEEKPRSEWRNFSRLEAEDWDGQGSERTI